MPPSAGSRSTAGTGGRSGASSLRSSSQPPRPGDDQGADVAAAVAQRVGRQLLEDQQQAVAGVLGRAEATEGCAMRARRSMRTREMTGIASSCQCQTSPGTEGTGARGHASGAGSSAGPGHRLPLGSAPQAGPDPGAAGSILTDTVRVRRRG